MSQSCQFQGVHRQPLAVGYNRTSALVALMEKHANDFLPVEQQRKIDYAECRRVAMSAKSAGQLRQLTIDEQAQEFKRKFPTPAATRGQPLKAAITAAVEELLAMGDVLPYGAISKAAKRHGAHKESVRERYIVLRGKPNVVRNQAADRAVEWLMAQASLFYGAYTVAAKMFGAHPSAVRNRFLAEKLDRRQNAKAAA